MPPKRSPGRPPKGILETHRRILLLLDPKLVDRYDRLSDRRTRDTGRPISRHEVIREALESYIDQALPPRRRRHNGDGTVATGPEKAEPLE